jgi:predicted GNAT family acetyltransferase
MDEVEVVDDVDRSRFEAVVDGHEAELVYRREEEHLVLTHTGVPDELGGRGVGGALVRAAVDDAAGRGLTIVPECSFARRWLERHPDDAARASIAWPPT